MDGGAGGVLSPGYAEWEAQEAQRERVRRMGVAQEQEAAATEAETSPPRGNQSASSTESSASGSEGSSPVRSSYGRYLLARSASCRPHQTACALPSHGRAFLPPLASVCPAPLPRGRD